LDPTDIQIESDFLPIVREVLGRVPGLMQRGVEDLDAQDRLRKQQQQQQQEEEGGQEGQEGEGATAGAAGLGRGGTVGFRVAGAGVSGVVSFRSISSSNAGGGGEQAAAAAGAEGEAAAGAEAAAASPPAELKLDDETLAAVSRAIMGRLDIVDLVGKNTAYDVAERVSQGGRGEGRDGGRLSDIGLWGN
jgi:cell division protease FtsH